jgi:hypothetical protein
LTLTAVRFLVAVRLFMILAAGRLRVPRWAVRSIIALGIIGITLGNVAQSFGVQGMSASAGTIISATIPIFIVIFAAIRQGLGLFGAFAGIALVAIGSGSGADDLTRTTAAGLALMLVSAVAIAFYYVWSAELTEKHGTLPIAAWNALAGLVAILPGLGTGAHTRADHDASGMCCCVPRRHGDSRGPAVMAVSAAGGPSACCGERTVPPAGVRDRRGVGNVRRPPWPYVVVGVILILGGLALAVAKRPAQEAAMP